MNRGFLGLLYTSFYLCRYNLSIANKSISDEFGFSRADMGIIITTVLLTCAFGQILNGLLTDRFGGKKAMLIGASGTIAMNYFLARLRCCRLQKLLLPVTAEQRGWHISICPVAKQR